MKTARTSTLPFLNSRGLIDFALYAAGLVLVFAPTSGTAGERQYRRGAESIAASARSRQVESHRRPCHCTRIPNGDVVAGWAGSWWPAVSATVAYPPWQALNCTIRRPGCGWRPVAWALYADHTRRPCCRMGRCWWPAASATISPLGKRRTIRSGDRRMDGNRQHGHCTRRSHGDVAAEWAGVGGRRSRQRLRSLGKC